MSAFDPQTLSLLATAATGVMNAIPKGQLAKLGLTRLPLVATLPVVGAVAGGAFITALAIPQSRKWMFEKGKLALESVQGLVKPEADPEDPSEVDRDEYSNVTVMNESSAAGA